MSSQDHSKFHNPDAFCGSAGPEELKHLEELISILTDEELVLLVKRVGIEFMVDPSDREAYENVIDEAEREDFYREYKRIINSKKSHKP